MLTIGPHVSVSDGFEKMGRHMLALRANTGAFFTRNPRGGSAKPLDMADVEAFLAICRENRFGKLVAHAAYTLNAAGKEAHMRDFARASFAEDIARMEHFPGNYYNFHPGAHVGQGVEAGIGHIVQMINAVLTPTQTTTVLLETMSGSGSEVGGTFEELGEIIRQVEVKDRIGVCMDTCHVWAAGYDIANDLDGVLRRFDDAIGLKYLKAVHINDSVFPLGMHKDRHAKIGEGEIGLEALGRFVRHEALRDLPYILETRNDDGGWAKEIVMLRA